MRLGSSPLLVAVAALAAAGCVESENYRIRADALRMALAYPAEARESIAVTADRAGSGLPAFVRAALLESAIRLNADGPVVTLHLSEVDHRSGAAAFLVTFGSAAFLSGLGVMMGDLGSSGEFSGLLTLIAGVPLMVGGLALGIPGAVLLAQRGDGHGTLEVPDKTEDWRFLRRVGSTRRDVAAVRWNGGLGFQF